MPTTSKHVNQSNDHRTSVNKSPWYQTTCCEQIGVRTCSKQLGKSIVKQTAVNKPSCEQRPSILGNWMPFTLPLTNRPDVKHATVNKPTHRHSPNTPAIRTSNELLFTYLRASQRPSMSANRIGAENKLTCVNKSSWRQTNCCPHICVRSNVQRANDAALRID